MLGRNLGVFCVLHPRNVSQLFKATKVQQTLTASNGFCWKNYEFQIPALLFFLGSKNFGEGSWSRFNHLLCNEIHGFFHVRDTSLRMLTTWGESGGQYGGRYAFWKTWKKVLRFTWFGVRRDSKENTSPYVQMPFPPPWLEGCNGKSCVASAIFAYPKNDSNAWKSLKQGLHNKKKQPNYCVEEINVM